MQTHRANLEAGLDVTIHAHELPVCGVTLPVWTLITRGLSALHQREVILTIVRHDAAPEAFPEGVTGYIRALKHFASQGRIVDDGDVSGYGAPGPFRLGSFVGLTFMDAPTIPGIALPDGALAGVFLTEGEFAMGMTCSTQRVLNQLGKAARYFPTPYWSDPARQAVYTVQDVGKSLLGMFERASVVNATATLRGGVLDLSMPDTFALALAARTESRVGSAILPRRERGIQAALVWAPGQTEPEAIFAEGSTPTAVAAAFVAFLPNDAERDDIRFMEDGYVAMLSKESAQRLTGALRAGSPLELHGEGRERTIRITVTRSH
jgi:hypothetical protein